MGHRSAVIIAAGCGVLAVMGGCGGSTTSTAGSPATPPAASTTGAVPAKAPETTPPTTETTAPPAKPASTTPPPKSPAPAAGDCPSAATLQAAAKLDKGYTISATTIGCWRNWAVAGVKAPNAAQQGDGLILFSKQSTTGSWRKTNEGSSFDCADDLGLPAGAEHPAWCTFN